MRRAVMAVLAGGCGVVAAWWLWSGLPARYGELARVAVTEDAAPDTAYRLARVALTTTTGRKVVCALRVPAPGPRPRLGVVLLGGIGTGRRAATLVARDFGGLVLSCDYPWRDPSALSVPRFLLALPAIRRDVLGTPGALRIAASYLLSRRDMDGARLAGVGASLGVPVVSAWASRDDRVSAVALVMGGAGLTELFAANLGGRIRSATLRRPVAALLAWLLRPLEPGRTVGRIAPRPVLIVGALDDQRIPRRSTARLYAAAREPKGMQWFGGRHLLPGDTALLQAVTDSTFAWLTRHLGTQP
jgi:fermentation-respiration switch protein FrsA (DUF1100 family)